MFPVDRLRDIANTAVGLLLPPHCVGCGCGIPSGWWCDACQRILVPIRPPRCEICSQPFSGRIDHDFTCPNCHGRHFHFGCAVAAISSRGPIRTLIHSLKYHGATWAVHPLVEFGLLGLTDPRLDPSPDALVPVPLHPLRLRERGFNQSDLLARALAQPAGLPVRPYLRRISNTATQTHFDRNHRMRNLRDAFALGQNVSVTGKRLLLIDDVLTTGSTLDECARTLLQAGAASVNALTIARG